MILRKRQGRFSRELPDGFDDFGNHNLITFKSHHEALDDWALKELTGHYVNYRKQVSPSPGELLPETEFRLYAVAAGTRISLRLRFRGTFSRKAFMNAAAGQT